MLPIVILFCIGLFIMYVAKSSEWYRKAQAWDKMKRGDEYVQNYEELMETRQYLQFQARVNYIFISLSSFVNWALQRITQVRKLIWEE